MSLPLAGQFVVALEQAVAAPYCSARLADAGARVIKVERNVGDFARGYDSVVNGESSYFVWLNRGKESICLDIKDADDRQLLLSMLRQADIFIQNLAPGAAERAGLGSDDLRKRNERLITVDISGYGNEGEYRNMKAYDLLIQCESGLASITGSPTEPGRVGVSICDIACGMAAHAAVLEALIERSQTGRGKSLQISLFDSIADWMTVPLLHQEFTGKPPARVGINHPSIAPYGAYTCSDGSQLVIAIQNEREWQSFCESVLEKKNMASNDLYNSNIERCRNREAMDAEINQVVGRLSPIDLKQRLLDAGIAHGTVNDIAGLSQHPQLRRSTAQCLSGRVELVTPAAMRSGEIELRPVPALGEHGEAIRAEFATSK